jgi:type I restriction enzyme S subunit
MKKLPKNWVEVNMDSIVTILDNLRKPINSDERNKRTGNIPYYGATGQAGWIDDFLFDEELVLLGEDGAPFFEKTKNVAYIICGKSWVNNHAHVLKGKESLLLNKYLLHFLNFFDYTSYVGGTTRLKLNQQSLKSIPVFLPPLSEQQRIIAKVDTLFRQLENIKNSLKRVPELLKVFRQQVLRQAVTGKLTEEWRGTSSIIFPTSITIGNIFDEAPIGWKWEKMTDIAKLESGHTPRKSKEEYWVNGDVPWISLQDIRAAHGKEINITKYMPNNVGIANSSARILPIGTVCFCRDISVGFTTIMGKEMATSQHFANWICSDKIYSKFLLYSFMASRQFLMAAGTGTTVSTIYMPALKEFRILLPPKNEQLEIYSRVDRLFAKADAIEQQYMALKEKVDKLPQAILHKAFKGELIEQLDTDGDAADLLKEIQNLKESVTKSKKPKPYATNEMLRMVAEPK